MVHRPGSPSIRRPRGHCNGDEAARPDRRAVGGPAAAAAHRAWTGSAADMDQTAAHRREPVAGRGRRAVAGCAGELRVWAAASALVRRWQRDGTWHRLLTALQALADAAGRITWDVSVDSTICRVHQHAAGARKRGTGKRNHPAGSTTSRPITRWAALGAG